MAEFVARRCEDMIPQLEQMERIKLFTKNEIKSIANQRKEFEYKIQRHTKIKEDFLRYIEYEKDLLMLVRQRRKKLGIQAKKSDIDLGIINKIKTMYRLVTQKFQDDLSLWIASIMFCKQAKLNSHASQIIGRMIQIHQDKPKCWHIAAQWEMEEKKNLIAARKYIFAGLRIHKDSQLLYTDLFTLELKQAEEENAKASSNDENPNSIEIEKAFVIFKSASEKINDLNFMIKLMNISKVYKNTEKLVSRMINIMIEKYSNEPQLWDVLARRELQGYSHKLGQDGIMEVDEDNTKTLRDKIESCNEIYKNAIEQLNSSLIWSLYIDCLIELNQDNSQLPNYKCKLLENALLQGHRVGKLDEKYYLIWINMLKENEISKDKIYEIMTFGTEAIPRSIDLWRLKLKHLINNSSDKELIEQEFNKSIQIFGAQALPIWQMKLLYYQAKVPTKVEDLFKSGINNAPEISIAMRVPYIQWLLLTRGIEAARKKYQELCVMPPLSLELHTTMAELELNQSSICINNARKPYDNATFQYGKTHVQVWLDYIIFEMKYGDAMKASNLYRRAIKTLEPDQTDRFIAQHSLLLANSDKLTASEH